MPSARPAFIITIDTEPDNQWTRASFRDTENVKHIPRFQELAERYGFKPVYLTEFNVAADPFFIEYMNDRLDRGTCEIGAHLHAWSTPPFAPLTGDDAMNKPYLIDYPAGAMREKLQTLLDRLEKNFRGAIHSHRAGRWAFDTSYLAVLREFGVKVDCSVLPRHLIAPSSAALPHGGADFRHCPDIAYEMDSRDFSRPGDSGVLEVPMTVRDRHPFIRLATALASKRQSERHFGLAKLRPERGNLADLLEIVDNAERKRLGYVEFMLHSSEFMPGCSLAFPDEASVERMFEDLEALFERASRTFTGMTLKEFSQREASGV